MADQYHAASIADSSRPNAGRIYDYVLGGSHNFEVDRIAAQQFLKIVPDYPQMARYVRWFLGEAVRRLAAEGFTHFIDFASGLPTRDHIHQVTPAGTRVIYSDIDPVTVAYGQEIIKDSPNARYVVCDAAAPETLLGSPLVMEAFGASRRVAFGLNGIAFFLTDEQLAHTIKTLYDWAEKGARLFLCDFDYVEAASHVPHAEESDKLWESMGQGMHWRTLPKLREIIKPWNEGEGFKPLEEWVQLRLRPEDKKTPLVDRLRGAILEK
jgi:O-methyltransferase involved in polyketide biosynthesis